MSSSKQDSIFNFLKQNPVFSSAYQAIKSHQILIFVLLDMFLIITAYVWLISFGSWIKWPTTTNYYNQLATAFEHRSLSLETEPNRALLALPNPYDPSERAGVNFLKDTSLYNNKYYLYFGPVPALIMASIKSIGVNNNFGDQYPVFVFVSGIFIFESLLILKIWKHFFQNIPVRILLICIVFSGLISPFTWILTQARIYEAAATGGQFFFMAGLYFVISALEQKSYLRRNLFFFIGGISWTLAIGSRLTQILPIGLAIIIITFTTIKTYHKTKELLNAIFAMELLGSPIIIGVSILARYNWARFHSVFETGLSYQLAGSNLQEYRHVLFSPLYILPNLYNYLAMPPHINGAFPFLSSIPGTGASIFSFITLPEVYYDTPLTGLLFSMPFVLFAGISIISLVQKKKNLQNAARQDESPQLFKYLTAILLGSFLLEFIPFICFFWVAPHYQIDFVPSLLILSIIGFWQGYIVINHKPIAVRNLYIAAGILLMIASIISSILLVLSAHTAQFQKFDPGLWKQLISMFSR